MKVNIEIDCTPEEARAFLGLPDVSKVNAVYVDNLTKALQGVTSLEQLKELSQQWAPMGQFGIKLFQNILEGGAAFAKGATGRAKKDD
ncbi:MAG: DUF6489 family protein [Novosphingobium sp.]|nr:DUF6489 family protein [Novosphingobium sp.]